jgi:hypothetical protein
MRIPFLNRRKVESGTIYKRMVVLAFSFKHGGRCIAGREVTFSETGRPSFGAWIRPVRAFGTGELLPAHYEYYRGGTPSLLDIVDVPVRQQQPEPLQPENWLVDEREQFRFVARLPAVYLSSLCEDPKGFWGEPGQRPDRVSATFLERFPPRHSLLLTQLNDVDVVPDSRNGFRLDFMARGKRYRLKITDERFEERMGLWLNSISGSTPLHFKQLFACLSLGTEFEGFHYKLVAGIMQPKLGVPLFTIGHSNRTIEEFIGALSAHGVDAVADVRSQPTSQRFPQFSQNSLKLSLKEAGIQYVFLGDEFGARRSEPECYVDGQVAYDVVARTPAFQRGVDRILKGSKQYSIALMCAERDPLTCHRTILVCRYLWKYGFDIRHILDADTVEGQSLVEIRLCDEEKLNPKQVGLFSRTGEKPGAIDIAYEKRAKQIAYRTETGKGEGLYDRVHAEDR